MKFAAIDIGSNAIRLLLAQVVVDDNQVSCRKESLIRLPRRLGEDAFTQQGYPRWMSHRSGSLMELYRCCIRNIYRMNPTENMSKAHS